VTEDASLDAFAGSDEAAVSDGESTDGAADELTETAADDECESTAEAAPSVAPATSTYDWSPEGGECAECGASVERRWRGDGALVCADCKEW